MTPDELAEIEARLKAATPGPWVKGASCNHKIGKVTDSNDPLQRESDGVIEIMYAVGPGHCIDQDENAYDKVIKDADFIADAPTDIACLLERVRELEADLQLAKEGLEFYANNSREAINEDTLLEYQGGTVLSLKICGGKKAREILAKLNGGEG